MPTPILENSLIPTPAQYIAALSALVELRKTAAAAAAKEKRAKQRLGYNAAQITQCECDITRAINSGDTDSAHQYIAQKIRLEHRAADL